MMNNTPAPTPLPPPPPRTRPRMRSTTYPACILEDAPDTPDTSSTSTPAPTPAPPPPTLVDRLRAVWYRLLDRLQTNPPGLLLYALVAFVVWLVVIVVKFHYVPLVWALRVLLTVGHVRRRRAATRRRRWLGLRKRR